MCIPVQSDRGGRREWPFEGTPLKRGLLLQFTLAFTGQHHRMKISPHNISQHQAKRIGDRKACQRSMHCRVHQSESPNGYRTARFTN
jgi:hypothetical protein